jgi:hypothetical protein
MTRNLTLASMGAATFAAFFALFAWLSLHGFVGNETIELAGRAIAIRDGSVSLREIALAFPPVPYLLTAGFQHMLPEGPISGASLLTAVTAGILMVIILRSLLVVGYRWPTALAITAMLLANPALLHLSATGPSPLLLCFGAWLVATSAYRLRARSNIVDLMGFSASLAFLALCHPLGAMMALALASLLILILPPQVTSESTVGAYLTALFPFLLVAGGGLYVSWIFTGDPLNLLRTLHAVSADTQTDRIAAWLGDLSHRPLFGATFYGLLVLLNAPIIVGGLAAVRRRMPRLMPMAAFGLCMPVAGVLGDALGLASPPLLLVAPLIGFAAATVAVFPIEEQRPIIALLLVAASVIGGAWTMGLAANPQSDGWTQAMAGNSVVAVSEPDRAIGSALIGRMDVLIDTASAPAVIAGRKSAKGLVAPLSPDFELTRMSQRPTSRYLAVRSSGGLHRESDAVHAIFPKLYADGMPGYVRIYDHLGWRIYQRNPAALAWN